MPALGNLVASVSTQDSVTLWALGPVVEGGYPGQPAPADDPVQYVFRNGFTGTGDLPCRVAFRTEMIGRAIVPPPYWRGEAVYAPVSNRRVEFNGFAYCPTHRRRWCRTVLAAPADGSYRFDLATCGGVRIWVGGAERVRHEPFTRNCERRIAIDLDLVEGPNEILVHMEDLFERDTNWYFELTSADTRPLEVVLDADVPTDVFAQARAMFDNVRPAADVFVDEPAVLVFGQACAVDLPVSVRIVSNGHDHATLLDVDLVLGAGETRLDLGPSRAIADGYHIVLITIRLGDVALEKRIGAAFLTETAPRRSTADEDARKREALDHAALHGDPRIGRVLAMLATGHSDPAALERILEDTLAAIERREDCSDFVMVPLLWVWALHADDLPERFRARTRRAILEWRYWVDEPGNDVMWFWSENHTLCFHVSQYLAGRLFPDDVFVCSGRTGAEQMRLAEHRLGLWFDAIETHGFVEWNSAAYYPIDFIGLFGLYGFCDGSLRARTQALLDALFVMTGLHTLEGVPAGSMGRAYDKEVRAGPLTELAPFCYVGFGVGWLNTGVAALPLYCLSDYRVPEVAGRAALWAEPSGIGARYTQGHDHDGKLVLYKDRGAMLSTVVDHHWGRKGHQQHIVDVRLAGYPMARLWVNHPGEDDPWGVKRPSYWAGNGILPRVAQHGDTALMIYDLGEAPELAFVHAFAAVDGLDALVIDGRWLHARAGDGYCAIWASAPFEIVEEGATAGREFRAHGTRSGWVVTVGNGDGAAGFDTFIARTRGTAPSFDPAGLRLSAGTLALDWNEGLAVEGVPHPFDAMSTTPAITWGHAS